MATSKFCLLPGRGILRVSGPESLGFLQGLVTNNVDRLDAVPAISAALLTPQGKILFDFLLVRDGDDVLVDCAYSHRADLAKRLTFYKLRAKVEIADVSDELAVGALWNDEAETKGTEDVLVYADPRLNALGLRMIGPAQALENLARGAGAQPTPEAEYQTMRRRHGVAEGGQEIESGQHFPHDVNLDKLAGVDFRKGCYVGQEVVSRMHHKTDVRKRVLPVRFDSTPSNEDLEIRAGGKAVGTLLTGADGDGLAVIRLDRLETAVSNGEPVLAGEAPVSLIKPKWADFEVAGATEEPS